MAPPSDNPKKRFAFLEHWFRDGSLGKLFRHSGTLVAGDFAANAISVVSLALTARALGAELFGVLVLIQTYAAIVEELVTFQPWKAIIRFGAGPLEAGDRGAVKGLFRLGFCLDFGSAIVATILALVGTQFLGQWRHLDEATVSLLMLYSCGILANVIGTPTAILRLFERFKVFSLQKTLSAIIKLIGVSIAWWFDAGLAGFVVVWLVTSVFGHMTLLFFGLQTLRRNEMTGIRKSPFHRAGEVFRFSIWTNLVTTVSLPIKHFDKAIVGALISVESVGVYRIIKQIALLMTMVSDSVYQVIYPRLAGLLAKKDFDGAIEQARRTGLLLLMFTGTVALGVILVGSPVIRLLFGESFANDHLSLSTYMVLRSISCAFVVVHPLFLAMGYVRREVGILLIANTLYVVAALALGSAYGLIGIVLAYGLQFSTVLAIKLGTIHHVRKQDRGDGSATSPAT